MLKSPATLEIEIAGNISTLNVGAGIQRLAIPLVPGTPTFRIRRNHDHHVSGSALSRGGQADLRALLKLPVNG